MRLVLALLQVLLQLHLLKGLQDLHQPLQEDLQEHLIDHLRLQVLEQGLMQLMHLQGVLLIDLNLAMPQRLALVLV
jgi:hypothetical protein